MADLSRIIRALRGNTIQLSLRDLLIDEQASGCESYGNGADAMVATSVMKAVLEYGSVRHQVWCNCEGLHIDCRITVCRQ